MAKYGPVAFTLQVDAADGGALQDMSAHTQTINGVNIEKVVEESTTFGNVWPAFLQVGISKMDPIVVGGIYDDTSTTGPEATYNINRVTHAATRSVVITIGGSKTYTFEAWITKFDVKPVRGALTKYEVTLQPTGTVTSA